MAIRKQELVQTCAAVHDITMGDSGLHSPNGAQGATEWENIRSHYDAWIKLSHQLVQFSALLLASLQPPVNQASEALKTSAGLY